MSSCRFFSSYADLVFSDIICNSSDVDGVFSDVKSYFSDVTLYYSDVMSIFSDDHYQKFEIPILIELSERWQVR